MTVNRPKKNHPWKFKPTKSIDNPKYYRVKKYKQSDKDLVLIKEVTLKHLHVA